MTRTLDYYMALIYPIELTSNEDGIWFARIPTLPGCMTQGATRLEALQMIDVAKILWLEAALEGGIEIPEPKLICE